MITERCRMSDYDALELIFPPIGQDDFQNEEMALKLNFNIDTVESLMGVHDDE
jgi:hypothetical protein